MTSPEPAQNHVAETEPPSRSATESFGLTYQFYNAVKNHNRRTMVLGGVAALAGLGILYGSSAPIIDMVLLGIAVVGYQAYKTRKLGLELRANFERAVHRYDMDVRDILQPLEDNLKAINPWASNDDVQTVKNAVFGSPLCIFLSAGMTLVTPLLTAFYIAGHVINKDTAALKRVQIAAEDASYGLKDKYPALQLANN